MLLGRPRSERARVLAKETGAVFGMVEVCAMAGLGLMAGPRTARRKSGTMLVASLRDGVTSSGFFISRSARVRPKKASLVILPRLVRGLSASRVSPQPSQVSARE